MSDTHTPSGLIYIDEHEFINYGSERRWTPKLPDNVLLLATYLIQDGTLCSHLRSENFQGLDQFNPDEVRKVPKATNALEANKKTE